MATTIFTSQTPGVPNDNEGGGISLGTVFSSSEDGTIDQMRWFFPTTLPGVPVQGAIYQEGTQALLATATFSSTPVAGAWNTATLNTTVNVTAGTNYVAVVWSDGRYVATAGLFNGTAITNGALTAPADDPGLRNGRFAGGGTLQFPTNSFNGNGYFVDVIFEGESDLEIAPDGITVPVALGEPTLTWTGTVAPDGVSVPVTLGEPTLSQALTVAPDGITIPVALGEPTVSQSLSITPTGITVPVTLGEPEVAQTGDLEIAPDGLSIPVTVGSPTLTFTAPPSPLGVDLVAQLAAFVKECLCEAVALVDAPPEHCRYQIGAEGFAGVGMWADECCEGVAYVAVGDIYPSSNNFPDADIIRQIQGRCAIQGWAVDIKIGVLRCAPTGTDTRPPTDAEWNAAAATAMQDAQALRRASCCVRAGIDEVGSDGQFVGMNVVIGRQSQPAPQGGCMERSVTLTVQMPNCESC